MLHANCEWEAKFHLFCAACIEWLMKICVMWRDLRFIISEDREEARIEISTKLLLISSSSIACVRFSQLYFHSHLIRSIERKEWEKNDRRFTWIDCATAAAIVNFDKSNFARNSLILCASTSHKFVSLSCCCLFCALSTLRVRIFRTQGAEHELGAPIKCVYHLKNLFTISSHIEKHIEHRRCVLTSWQVLKCFGVFTRAHRW